MSNNAGSFWQQSWIDAQPTLEAVERRLASITKGLPRVIRVGQLDAELLDQELLAVLKQPISTSLSHIKVSPRESGLMATSPNLLLSVNLGSSI